jgi:transcriptional regulator with XRE-family HTH domain
MTQDDLIKMLKREQGKKSLRQFAEEIGISAPYLSDIYKGRRMGGKKVLDYFGLEKTTTVVTEISISKSQAAD